MSLLASSEKSRCGSAALQSGAGDRQRSAQQQQMINCSFSICKIDKFMAAADTQDPGSPGGITKITFISVMWEPSTADYGKRTSASTQRGIRLPAAR